MISFLKDIVKKRVQKYKNAPSERNWTHLVAAATPYFKQAQQQQRGSFIGGRKSKNLWQEEPCWFDTLAC